MRFMQAIRDMLPKRAPVTLPEPPVQPLNIDIDALERKLREQQAKLAPYIAERDLMQLRLYDREGVTRGGEYDTRHEH